jgi:hypothetical protein
MEPEPWTSVNRSREMKNTPLSTPSSHNSRQSNGVRKPDHGPSRESSDSWKPQSRQVPASTSHQSSSTISTISTITSCSREVNKSNPVKTVDTGKAVKAVEIPTTRGKSSPKVEGSWEVQGRSRSRSHRNSRLTHPECPEAAESTKSAKSAKSDKSDKTETVVSPCNVESRLQRHDTDGVSSVGATAIEPSMTSPAIDPTVMTTPPMTPIPVAPVVLGSNGSNEVRYYNNHIIHVNCGVARQEQLSSDIRRAVKVASDTLGRAIETSFKINIIIDRSGRRYGYGYVWFTNPEVYYMLLGKNPDGSENVQYREDPNWVPPPDAPSPRSLDDEMTTFHGRSWVDIMEEEERYTRPLIKIQLPPLMTLSAYQLDSQQKAIWRPYFEGEILFDNKNDFTKELHQELMAALPTTPLLTLLKAKDVASELQQKIRTIMIDKAHAHGYTFDGTSVIPPDWEKFKVAAAHVEESEPDVSHHILCGRYIPTWITEKSLKAIFTPYATDSVTATRRKVNGEVIADTYPFVTINNKRIAFVTFDSRTRDAQFALLMTRKLELSHGSDKVAVVFNQSYKSGSV